MLIYILFYFLFRNITLPPPVEASPILNTIANSTSFQPLPRFSVDAPADCRFTSNYSFGTQRSMTDIVWGCVSTVFLCTWLSIHMNAPAPREKSSKILWRRLKTMYWALVAPELVMLWAIRQYYGASHILKRYKLSDRNWTVKHAHFLQMGGFQLRDGQKTTVLYPNQFHDLLKKGEITFPNISADDIADKSKADSLSKIVLVGQILWFVAQCIARRIKRLALAQLEVTTLSIISCTFMLSILWWHKPFDIRQPFFLDKTVNMTEHKENISQVLADEHTNACEKDHLLNSIDNSAESEAAAVGFLNNGDDNEHTGVELLQTPRRSECSEWVEVPQTDADSDTLAAKKQSDTEIQAPSSAILSIINTVKYRAAKAFHKDNILLLSHCWIVFKWMIFDPIKEVVGDYKEKTERSSVSIYFAADFTHDDEDKNNDEIKESKIMALIPMLVLAVPPIVLGLVHCIAWWSVFPSTVEKTAWRVSSIMTTAVPLFVIAIMTLASMREEKARKHDERVYIVTYVVHAVAFLGLLFYLVARLYLVVEAFLSFRALPCSAFWAVEWTSIFPHI
ncbi:hypothetical protein BDQ17DRAFT_1275967 [Cyathus striatus]|nr:hypothetical protein BDQ17DRAFT_1275967 [Cyathus striatus]